MKMGLFLSRVSYFIVALFAFVASTFALVQQAQPPIAHVEKSNRLVTELEFASGGTVSLSINAGDLRIVQNPHQDKLRLEIMIESPKVDAAQAQHEWVKRMKIDANVAWIDLNLPSGKIAGAVTLYVPALTNLNVKMHAGKLVVSGVKGDKNLSVGSGILTLRESDPSTYKHVKADVSLGELSDGVFHTKQSGVLGRTLNVEGKGSYQLTLHVGTGDLALTGEDGSL